MCSCLTDIIFVIFNVVVVDVDDDRSANKLLFVDSFAMENLSHVIFFRFSFLVS